MSWLDSDFLQSVVRFFISHNFRNYIFLEQIRSCGWCIHSIDFYSLLQAMMQFPWSYVFGLFSAFACLLKLFSDTCSLCRQFTISEDYCKFWISCIFICWVLFRDAMISSIVVHRSPSNFKLCCSFLVFSQWANAQHRSQFTDGIASLL